MLGPSAFGLLSKISPDRKTGEFPRVPWQISYPMLSEQVNSNTLTHCIHWLGWDMGSAALAAATEETKVR